MSWILHFSEKKEISLTTKIESQTRKISDGMQLKHFKLHKTKRKKKIREVIWDLLLNLPLAL